MPGKLEVVVGGQFGSEAKGAVTAHLARKEPNLLAVRVAGPNAGHTVIGNNGREWKLQQVPVAAVSNPAARLAIAAGSEIEKGILQAEILELDAAGYAVSDRLIVDRSATLIEPHHQTAEAGGLVSKIGSTGKGVGAARAERAMRQAELYGGEWDVAVEIHEALAHGATVQIEGTQGYGLGQSAGFYPQCTSSNCRAVDFLSMAGANPWEAARLEIWVTYRTFPIRVAGNSGPLRNEIDWSDLGVEPEFTTVTKKVRRVAEWDGDLAREALIANGFPHPSVRVALSHLDYMVPDLAGEQGDVVITDSRMRNAVGQFEDDLGCSISLIGTGPDAYTDWS